jgi:hypothetical protein
MRAITFVLPTGERTSQPEVADQDAAHFLATFNRAMRLSEGDNVESCDVHMGERTKDRTIGEYTTKGGWLEHTIVVRYTGGRSLTVGAIQREPGVQSEFVS